MTRKFGQIFMEIFSSRVPLRGDDEVKFLAQ
jgi:hypothetical protein